MAPRVASWRLCCVLCLSVSLQRAGPCVCVACCVCRRWCPAALTAVSPCVFVLDPDGGGEPGHTAGSKADHHGKHFGTHLNVPGKQPLSLPSSPSTSTSTSLYLYLYLSFSHLSLPPSQFLLARAEPSPPPPLQSPIFIFLVSFVPADSLDYCTKRHISASAARVGLIKIQTKLIDNQRMLIFDRNGFVAFTTKKPSFTEVSYMSLSL